MPTNKTIFVDDKFNPMDGSKANDDEDSSLTSKIKVIPDKVDTSKTGTITLTYSITDFGGVTTIVTQRMTVKDSR